MRLKLGDILEHGDHFVELCHVSSRQNRVKGTLLTGEGKHRTKIQYWIHASEFIPEGENFLILETEDGTELRKVYRDES